MGLERARCRSMAVMLLCASGVIFAQARVSPGLMLPSGIAYDTAGNLFIADARRNQVFEVMLSGVTAVVAGTGEQGFAGDAGAATLALLSGPQAVAVAADGTVYIADTGNQRIRTVVGGVITTVAGSGVKGFSGTMLNTPLAIALDASGGLLIADSGNHRLRLLFAGILTTIAGTGVQGFSGDQAAAAMAQLDTPAGVAVGSDGRIFLADSHNHRLRVIATDGIITTFAGSGVRGFSGDGSAATGAALSLPRGVAVSSAGDVFFADSDNQRLRSVNSAGIISTIAGSGEQGSSADGTIAMVTLLDSPRGVAVSSFAAPAFADARNHLIREIASDAKLYALPAATGSTTLALVAPPALTYGQGMLGVAVAGSLPTVQGSVVLKDGSTVFSTTALQNAAAVVSMAGLSAGLHTLTATYSGDGLHGAATSSAVTVRVDVATVMATAQSTVMFYGAFTPALTGTLTGILVQDTQKIVANFAAGAPDLSPVGIYPIAVTLSGVASNNYALSLSPGSGSLQIVQAAPVLAINWPATAFAGLPVTMSASVAPATRGAPTGIVNFLDGATPVARGTIAGGIATAVYLSPATGSHSLTASYSGDQNFQAATSPVTAVSVGAMPDFIVAVQGTATQTVQGGAIAVYVLQVAGLPGPFTGSVSMGASGLPKGATASFSPTAVVPGSSSADVTLSIQTVALTGQNGKPEVSFAALLLFALAVPWAWRHRRLRCVPRVMALALFCVASSTGCGDRVFPALASATQTSPITVTATSTNLAGATVVHAVSLTLVVR